MTRSISSNQFLLACCGVRLKLTSPIELPVYKGDVFHRAFGKALERTSPRFGRYFFNPKPPPDWPDPGQTPLKPFLLVPPLSEQTDYCTGDALQLGITLFGEATQYTTTVFTALEKLGAGEGIEQGKDRFQIQRMVQITPSEVLGLLL
jgi:hypothetical protein